MPENHPGPTAYAGILSAEFALWVGPRTARGRVAASHTDEWPGAMWAPVRYYRGHLAASLGAVPRHVRLPDCGLWIIQETPRWS